MSAIVILMEGGGDSTDQKSLLRQGMNTFLDLLKSKVRAKSWRWKLVACGSRKDTYDAFINERNNALPGEITILLVDSEDAIATGAKRTLHLQRRRGDGWNMEGVHDENVHLMAQTMETWILADPEALAQYYGQNFQVNALPSRQDLEEEPKADCIRKLRAATKGTQKGENQKIRHASHLLAKIAPSKVRLRCRHADIMFMTINQLLDRDSQGSVA